MEGSGEPTPAPGEGREASAKGDGDTGPSRGPDVSAGRPRSILSRRKWAILGGVVILALAGAALMVPGLRLPVPKGWLSDVPDRGPLGGDLREERLDPFYLPLSEGGEALVLRLDVLVRWERATAARFKSEAPWIRAKLYEGLLSRFKGDPSVSDRPDRLEEEIERSLRRLLGDKDVRIVLERIRAI